MVKLAIDPIKDIEDTYKNKDFFKAFVLAVAYFEYETNSIFGELFKDRVSVKAVSRWPLKFKIRLLFGLNLIDYRTHEKISQIIQVRNNLVHPADIWKSKARRMQDIFLKYRLQEEEKSLLLSFKDCYGQLVNVRLWDIDLMSFLERFRKTRERKVS